MRLYERALELLFPPRCALCGRVGVRGLCPKCESTLPLCRTPLHVRKGIGTCVAPLRYDGTREALLAYKFSGGRSRCAGFGEILAQCVSEQLGGEFDVVSFVPVSEKRRRERGYDQSELLAREVCRIWGVEPKRLLRKVKNNRAQSSLSSREERAKNVVGAYEAVAPEKIAGARILLIDDILTTGATLSECARVLREAGAERVLCATLAATDEG